MMKMFVLVSKEKKKTKRTQTFEFVECRVEVDQDLVGDVLDLVLRDA